MYYIDTYSNFFRIDDIKINIETLPQGFLICKKKDLDQVPQIILKKIYNRVSLNKPIANEADLKNIIWNKFSGQRLYTRPGVITTIKEICKREGGASIPELIDILIQKFPDRSTDSMKTTCRINLVADKNKDSELVKCKDKDRGGTVYQLKPKQLESNIPYGDTRE